MEINGNSPLTSASAQEAKKQSQLSVDDFLKIMAAEIQNQNPTGGSEGGGSKTDYLTQLAQFTTLEQISEITEGMNQLNMLSQTALIGKTVKIYGEDTDLSGVVDRVKFYNSQTYIQVDGNDYPIGLLMEVEETAKIDPVQEMLSDIQDSLNRQPVEEEGEMDEL